MIAVLGLNPAVDKIVSLQSLQWGRHLRVRKVREVAAGKGINVARVIRRLGEDVVVIGVSGGPNGEWIKRELKKEKIKFDFVEISGNIRQNLTVMDERKGREIHFIEQGPAMRRRELDIIRNRIKKWAGKINLFVISGRLPRGVPVNFYKEIVSFFKKRNIPVLLDANGPALVKAVRAIPRYIKPNHREIEEIAGMNLEKRDKKIGFIKGLLGKGIEMVVATNGPRCVLGMTRDIGISLIPPGVKIKNTVGSGDAVTGALAYGLARALDFKKMLRLSVACGTANAVSIGAGFLDMRKVDALIKKVDVKVLYNHCD